MRNGGRTTRGGRRALQRVYRAPCRSSRQSRAPAGVEFPPARTRVLPCRRDDTEQRGGAHQRQGAHRCHAPRGIGRSGAAADPSPAAILVECRRSAGKKSLVLLATALALSGQSMNPRIAVGGILHESNTFPSDLTGLGDLRGRSIRLGDLQEQSNCVAARRDRVGPRQSLRNAAADFCDAATSNLAPVIAE